MVRLAAGIYLLLIAIGIWVAGYFMRTAAFLGTFHGA